MTNKPATLTTDDLRDLVEGFRSQALIAPILEKIPAERHAYIRGLETAAFFVRELIKYTEAEARKKATTETVKVIYTTADPFDFD